MDIKGLQDFIQLGESSTTQFKEKLTSADALAAEICAFANTQGGKIIAGVNDSGSITGLTTEEVGRLNQMISNVCSQKNQGYSLSWNRYGCDKNYQKLPGRGCSR